MSNRAISAIGFTLGAALVGIPIGVHIARTLRIPAGQNHQHPTPRKAKA